MDDTRGIYWAGMGDNPFPIRSPELALSRRLIHHLGVHLDVPLYVNPVFRERMPRERPVF